jgi:hypothetical protein
MIKTPERNPVRLLRHSARTLKDTWSEAILGYAGLSGGFTLGLLAWMLIVGCFIWGAVYVPVIGGYLVLVGLAAGLLGLVVAAYASALATNIHRCALYLYATEGVVPGPYRVADMNAGWRVR